MIDQISALDMLEHFQELRTLFDSCYQSKSGGSSSSQSTSRKRTDRIYSMSSNAEYQRRWRNNQSEEKRLRRLRVDREAHRLRRQKETPEQREIRRKRDREAQRKRHWGRTAEEHQEVLRRKREIYRWRRQRESPEERAARIKKHDENRMKKRTLHIPAGGHQSTSSQESAHKRVKTEPGVETPNSESNHIAISALLDMASDLRTLP
jgi:hypothetical protein